MAAAARWTALMTRLGIDNQTNQELRRVGIGSLEAIEALDKSEIQRMCEHVMRYPHPNRPADAVVCISAPAIKNMQTLACWCILRRRIGLEPQPVDFTVDALNATKERAREVKACKDAEEDQDITKPGKLKFMSKWITFWESLQTCFGSIRGAADIPLSHVFRTDEEVENEHRNAVHATWDDYCARCTILDGVHYVADNTRVWNEIKPLIYDGPGWDFIRQFEPNKDGREAILALMVQNESLNSKTTRKNKAHKALSSLVYSGPKKNFAFENYVSAHLHGHHELQACGEPVPETKKVNDFLEGIEDERLESAKDSILGDPVKLSNFDETQRYLSLVVTNKKISGNKRRGRQIAEQSSSKRRRANDKETSKGVPNHGLPINGTKSYSKHEWFEVLSPTEREKVLELRKQNKKNKKARKASAADSKPKPSSSDDESEAEPTLDAGNQFGRGSHKKKKE